MEQTTKHIEMIKCINIYVFHMAVWATTRSNHKTSNLNQHLLSVIFWICL